MPPGSLSTAPLPEVPLETGSLLVADLHLDLSPAASREAEEQRERFTDWLAAIEAPRLVILGDLFDAWVGPAHARLEAAQAVIEGLAGLARRGTAVDVVHGNRDFLLDARFERQSGARVFPNGCIGRPVEAEGSPACLLIHGDELCTLDRGYQRLKRVLRSPAVAWTAPRLPARLSLAVARRLRRASVRALAHKPRAEATQQPEAVLALAAIHAAGVVVCGHAHAFRDERLVPAQPPVGLQGGSPGGRGGVRWIVIGAFGTPNDLLRVGAGGRIEPGRVRA